MDIGRISTHSFCFRENESTTLSLWRHMTGKDEKEFRLESRTLKERFLRDFVEGTLWIGVVEIVILERRLRAKIKNERLGRRSWSFFEFWRVVANVPRQSKYTTYLFLGVVVPNGFNGDLCKLIKKRSMKCMNVLIKKNPNGY